MSREDRTVALLQPICFLFAGLATISLAALSANAVELAMPAADRAAIEPNDDRTG